MDQIVEAIHSTSCEASVVFNCQNGVGRTTVGMVIAAIVFSQNKSLLFDSASSSAAFPRPSHSSREHWTERKDRDRTLKVIQETEKQNEINQHDSELTEAGNVLAVRRLIHLLSNGIATKRLVDTYIDLCDQLVNIKAEIDTFRKKCARTPPESSHRHVAFKKSVVYLHRYCFLISLAAYTIQSKPGISFQQWMGSRYVCFLFLRRFLL